MDDDKATSEAELAALWLSGELTPPADLAARVRRELAAIRSQFAEIADPGAGLPELPGLPTPQPARLIPPWEPGVVILTFDETTADDVAAGLYSPWDAPNEAFGVVDVDVVEAGHAVALRTEALLHPVRMAEQYRALPGAVDARPSPITGEGDQIYPWMSGDEVTYLFCRVLRDESYPGSPVLHRTFHYFVIEGDEPRLAGVRETEHEGLEPPEWWPEARTGVRYVARRGRVAPS